jgi:hypothetical protein
MNIKEKGRDLTPYIPMMHFPEEPPLMDPVKVRAMLEPEDDKYNAPMPRSTKIVLGLIVLALIAAIGWSAGVALFR